MDLNEIWCEDVNIIHFAQDRVQWQAPGNPLMNLWVT